MESRKRELIKEYKQNLRPVGVYQILNTVNSKIFVGSSTNLPGIINRDKFGLKAGMHLNKRLQSDWNTYGADKFVFEVLEELKPSEGCDIKAELALLEEIWLDTLQPYGDRGYNEPKKSQEAKLQRIIRNRSKQVDAVNEEDCDQ